MDGYDPLLSLEIDWCHLHLDDLRYRRSLAAWAARCYWHWRLRRLERRIPV